jgi:hypothetical protein
MVNAALHEGLMIGHLQHKGACEECGEDHLRGELESKAPFADKSQSNPVGPDVPGRLPLSVHEGRTGLYQQYNVAPMTDNPEDARVRCLGRGGRGCHMQWPTIGDREANAGPNDCPGCHMREAHG